MQTKSVALGGLSAAFVVIILYMASVMPTSRLFMLCLCSFAVAVMVIETGLKNGTVFYLATSALGFLLIPGKTVVLLYITFFGIYGLLKAKIETLQSKVLELALKLVSFNLALIIVMELTKVIAGFDNIPESLPLRLGVLWLGLQLAFIFYDYTFTIVISCYYKHLHGKI